MNSLMTNIFEMLLFKTNLMRIDEKQTINQNRQYFKNNLTIETNYLFNILIYCNNMLFMK